MTEAETFERLTCVTQWSKDGVRAPHKPLLLILALGGVQQGKARLRPFSDVEELLADLLAEYGPPGKALHPEYPFWYLQSDGFWEVPGATEIEVEAVGARDLKGKKWVPTKSAMRTAEGGLSADVYEDLRSRPSLVNRIVQQLLDDNFPSSFHDEILDAVDFPWVVEFDRRRTRDPAFRENILRIYEHRCAFCGYDGKLGRNNLGIEAAHVRWVAAHGPDDLDNGLALCSFHHTAFDRGALGLSADGRILVSQEVHGLSEVDHLVLRLAGQRLCGPQVGTPGPAASHTAWHRNQVFRAPPRPQA